MKLGLGLYRRMLTEENFRFARQAGATHIVAHLVGYFASGPRIPNSESAGAGWGAAGLTSPIWSYEELRDLRASINAAGLELAGIENFDPAHWHDILLDGPKRAEQIEGIKTILRNMGRAGIPVMGYNFSIAGVWGHITGPWARGGAESVAFLGAKGPVETPLPLGMVWNMVYDPAAPAGTLSPVTSSQVWDRLQRFLAEVLPVAEEAGVRLALHPDDPPQPTLRGQARLVNQPDLYQRLIDLSPSPSNAIEFCAGSIAEMSTGDVYSAAERYGSQNRLGYVHLRNVRGKVPEYYEVFIDEGDIDVFRLLRTLRAAGYDGVITPDHTPQMSCDAPWHAGMAYALGYLRAALTAVETLG